MYSLDEVKNVDPEIAQAIVDEQNRRVFDTFSSTHMSLSQYWLYFFVKFKTTSSPLCVVVL